MSTNNEKPERTRRVKTIKGKTPKYIHDYEEAQFFKPQKKKLKDYFSQEAYQQLVGIKPIEQDYKLILFNSITSYDISEFGKDDNTFIFNLNAIYMMAITDKMNPKNELEEIIDLKKLSQIRIINQEPSKEMKIIHQEPCQKMKVEVFKTARSQATVIYITMEDKLGKYQSEWSFLINKNKKPIFQNVTFFSPLMQTINAKDFIEIKTLNEPKHLNTH